MTAPTDNPAIASKEDEETDWWHGPRLRSAYHGRCTCI